MRGKLAVDVDHGQLDEVGGGALQRRIERGAFGEAAQIGLRRDDFGDRAAAARERAA